MCSITAEYFTRCTLRQPQDDDLERSNCDKAGQRGHTWCGWNHTLNLPRYMVGDSTDDSLRVVPKGESK